MAKSPDLDRDPNMKRFGNLYERICDPENIRQAHQNARRGKTRYRSVQQVDADVEPHVMEIHRLLSEGRYRTSPYHVFERMDNGKKRVIYALPYFPDRIIHHCIMQVVEPIWQAGFIRDTYAGMKKRGVHDGVRRLQAALRHDPAGTRYCLKMDVRQFYPSLNHDYLKTLIRRKIKDQRLLGLLDEIIDSVPGGVPIGNYLSQYLGNLYLSAIDHQAKEGLGLRYYYRYCDDTVILGDNKARLHQVCQWYTEQLSKIGLQLKPNWQVFPVAARGIDFLGYRFFHHRTLLRRRIAQRFRQQMRRLRKHWHRLSRVSALSTVMSYYGWARFANASRLFIQHVSPSLRRRLYHHCGPSRLSEALS